MELIALLINKDMALFILEWDFFLFQLINKGLANPVFDVVFNAVTFLGRIPLVFVPLWIVFMILGKSQDRLIGLMMILVLVLSDALPTYVLKPLFARLRPLFELEGVRVLSAVSNQISQYGFPSNHASNIFAICSFLFLHYRNKILFITLLIISCGVCFSRIYAGVHYPLDVLAGAALGLGVGWLVYWMQAQYESWRYSKTVSQS